MAQEPEEDIVSATQTELAFLLVFVFVTLLGFHASREELKAGSGVVQQGLPKTDGRGALVMERARSATAPPTIPVVGHREDPGAKIASGPGNGGEFGAKLAAPLREKRCQLSGHSDGQRFTLLLEGASESNSWMPQIEFETCAQRARREEDEDRQLSQSCSSPDKKASCEAEIAAQRQLYFRVGQSAITAFGRDCLRDLCRRVYTAFKAQPDKYRHILIEGHTSSEWKPGASCRGMKTASAKSPLAGGYQCNMQLSTDRAMTIYDECWAALSDDSSLTLERYQTIFKPIGNGAINVRRDAKGCEKRRESRRVEFAFIE